jgi:GT2 family glycosyltransferase
MIAGQSGRTTVPRVERRGGDGTLPSVDVVVLAYGAERWLGACLDAALGSVGVIVRIILVDNGCPEAQAAAARDERVLLLSPGRNTGYAGGCVLGAAAGTAPTVVFVNSDAVVEPTALRAMIEALQEDSIGLVTGCVLLGEADGDGEVRSDDGTPLVNAAGNPVHWLGWSWAGGFRDPVGLHQQRCDVASASGALCGLRRAVWDAVGGFDPTYFAYHEDVDLSWRIWCSGRRVVYLPESRCLHHYEFSRHPAKLDLLERNRLLTVLTVYQWRTLARIGPALLLTEAGVVLLAFVNGWGPAKVRGMWWLLRHPGDIRRRRRWVDRIRAVSDSAWSSQLNNTLDLPPEAPGQVPGPVGAILQSYGRLARLGPVHPTACGQDSAPAP